MDTFIIVDFTVGAHEAWDEGGEEDKKREDQRLGASARKLQVKLAVIGITPPPHTHTTKFYMTFLRRNEQTRVAAFAAVSHKPLHQNVQ